MVSVVPKLVDF